MQQSPSSIALSVSMVGSLMCDELQTIRNLSGRDLSQILSRYLPRATEKNHEEMARILTVIKNEPLPNTCLEHYLFASPLNESFRSR